MKGAYGLVLAITLGLVAGLLNWVYLENKTSDEEKEAFIGVKPDAEIDQGQRLEGEQLVKVEIPRRAVGNLKEYAVSYTALQSVVGRPVWRRLSGGSLLLEMDLRTPPQEMKFGPNERVVWVSVDLQSMVPSLIVPGDLVSFRVPPHVVQAAERPSPGNTESPQPGGGDVVGPFKILSLGNRLGTSEVLRAAKVAQVQENVIAIAVNVDKSGNLAPDAEKLLKILDTNQSRPMRIILHPRQSKNQ